MSDSQTEPGRTWTTAVVERSIKQPVKAAVREVLAEHEAARRAERSVADDSDESATTDTDTDRDEADETDGEDTTSSGRPSAPRLLLVAGGVAGAVYAATRWRRRNDSSADAEEQPDDGTDAEEQPDDETDAEEQPDDGKIDSDIDDASPSDSLRDGERSTAPAEDATAN